MSCPPADTVEALRGTHIPPRTPLQPRPTPSPKTLSLVVPTSATPAVAAAPRHSTRPVHALSLSPHTGTAPPVPRPTPPQAQSLGTAVPLATTTPRRTPSLHHPFVLEATSEVAPMASSETKTRMHARVTVCLPPGTLTGPRGQPQSITIPPGTRQSPRSTTAVMGTNTMRLATWPVMI